MFAKNGESAKDIRTVHNYAKKALAGTNDAKVKELYDKVKAKYD
jgi:hypothetical protein